MIYVLCYACFVNSLRCSLVINLLEGAHKVTLKDEDCEECGASIINVDYGKVSRCGFFFFY